MASWHGVALRRSKGDAVHAVCIDNLSMLAPAALKLSPSTATSHPLTAILLLFYSSPLSTILLVLRTRNSSSLQLPLSVMNIINGAWWQRGVFWARAASCGARLPEMWEASGAPTWLRVMPRLSRGTFPTTFDRLFSSTLCCHPACLQAASGWSTASPSAICLLR